MTPKKENAVPAIAKAENFLKKFVSFREPEHAFVLALWAFATHIHLQFDAFPYVVITASTKQSGKTVCSEVAGFLASGTVNVTAMTPAAMYRTIADEHPTIICDEAESLSGGNAGVMREFLNSGYRKGQTIRRVVQNSVREFPTYCPKMFVLIGDVYDTLRDRSIVITLQRGKPAARYGYTSATEEAKPIREEIHSDAEFHSERIVKAYWNMSADFLRSRDEEIWRPLFAVCEVVCPERMLELKRIAVDVSTEKTERAKVFINLAGEEQKAEDNEYATRVLDDLISVLESNNATKITSLRAVEELKKIDLAPWRKFRGEGISQLVLSQFLSRFGVKTSAMRVDAKTMSDHVADKKEKKDSGKNQNVARCYGLTELRAAKGKHL